MIVSNDLFVYRMICRVGTAVRPALTILASNMDQADNEAALHWSQDPGYNGEPIVTISATVVDLTSL